MKTQEKMMLSDYKYLAYTHILYEYGFMCLLMLSQELEQEGCYEDCVLISRAINQHNRECRDNIPEIYDESAIKHYKKLCTTYSFSFDDTILEYENILPDVRKRIDYLINSFNSGI